MKVGRATTPVLVEVVLADEAGDVVEIANDEDVLACGQAMAGGTPWAEITEPPSVVEPFVVTVYTTSRWISSPIGAVNCAIAESDEPAGKVVGVNWIATAALAPTRTDAAVISNEEPAPFADLEATKLRSTVS